MHGANASCAEAPDRKRIYQKRDNGEQRSEIRQKPTAPRSGGWHRLKCVLLEALLLEEVFESLAGVTGTRRSGCAGTGGLRVRCRRGVLFDGHPKFVELAMVLGVFGGDAFLNRLRAFELRAGVEEAALLATMQFELALGALAIGIETRGEDSAAIGTAGPGDRPHHPRGARPELVGAAGAAGWRFFFVRAIALLTLLRIAVTAMTILAIHKRLRPPVLTDCNGYNLDLYATMCQLGLYPTGLLHSAGLRNTYLNLLAE